MVQCLPAVPGGLSSSCNKEDKKLIIRLFNFSIESASLFIRVTILVTLCPAFILIHFFLLSFYLYYFPTF